MCEIKKLLSEQFADFDGAPLAAGHLGGLADSGGHHAMLWQRSVLLLASDDLDEALQEVRVRTAVTTAFVGDVIRDDIVAPAWLDRDFALRQTRLDDAARADDRVFAIAERRDEALHVRRARAVLVFDDREAVVMAGHVGLIHAGVLVVAVELGGLIAPAGHQAVLLFLKADTSDTHLHHFNFA